MRRQRLDHVLVDFLLPADLLALVRSRRADMRLHISLTCTPLCELQVGVLGADDWTGQKSGISAVSYMRSKKICSASGHRRRWCQRPVVDDDAMLRSRTLADGTEG